MLRLLPALTVALVAVAMSAPVAGAATNTISAFAGDGTPGFGGDGGLATLAQLNGPVGLDVAPDGSVLIADAQNHRVRRVRTDGIIETVAGTGVAGFSGDNGPATSAQLNDPMGVAAQPDGGFLIVDRENARIRRVSPLGIITTVAGGGTAALSDGVPAVDVQLPLVLGLAVTADGGFLFTATFENKVWRVSPAGKLTTAAGTGTAGFSGDGGPATSAELSFPFGVATTADGGFVVADLANWRVRRVAADGTITTVAGSGALGSGGDGGPATAAQLGGPTFVETTPDGGLLISDTFNRKVRRVTPGGRMLTVAGSGALGSGGDGGPATLAEFSDVTGLAVTADGGFLVADDVDHRVRYVDAGLLPPGAGPQGPPGPAGPAGPAGPPGVQSPPAPAVVLREAVREPRRTLLVAVADERVDTRSGRRLTVRYLSTLDGRLEAVLLRGRRRVGSTSHRVEAGGNSLRVRAPRRPGRYWLELRVTSEDGQRVTERVRLIVRRAVLRGRPRAGITVRYASPGAGRVVTRVVRQGRIVERVQRRARPGANAVRLRAPSRPGRYRIELRVRVRDEITADRVRLVVRR